MKKTALEYYTEALEEVTKTINIVKEPSLLEVIEKIIENSYNDGRRKGESIGFASAINYLKNRYGEY